MGPEQALWYRRKFNVPDTEAWKDKRIDMHFGAVDWSCQVYLNGKELEYGSYKIVFTTATSVGTSGYLASNFKLTDKDGNPIKGTPRHPIVEDNVIIYAQATILGRIRIGANSVIGGNVWVTNSLPPNTKLVQSKAKENDFSDGAGI